MNWGKRIETISKIFEDKVIVILLIIFIGLCGLIPLVKPNIQIIIVGLIAVVIIAFLIRTSIITRDNLPLVLMITGLVFIILAFCFCLQYLQLLPFWRTVPLLVFATVPFGIGFLLQHPSKFPTKGTFEGFPKKDEYEKESKEELLRPLGEKVSG